MKLGCFRAKAKCCGKTHIPNSTHTTEPANSQNLSKETRKRTKETRCEYLNLDLNSSTLQIISMDRYGRFSSHHPKISFGWNCGFDIVTLLVMVIPFHGVFQTIHVAWSRGCCAEENQKAGSTEKQVRFQDLPNVFVEGNPLNVSNHLLCSSSKMLPVIQILIGWAEGSHLQSSQLQTPKLCKCKHFGPVLKSIPPQHVAWPLRIDCLVQYGSIVRIVEAQRNLKRWTKAGNKEHEREMRLEQQYHRNTPEHVWQQRPNMFRASKRKKWNYCIKEKVNDQTCKNVRKAHVIHTFAVLPNNLWHTPGKGNRDRENDDDENKNQAPTHSSGPRGIEIPKRPAAFEFLHCARINSSGKSWPIVQLQLGDPSFRDEILKLWHEWPPICRPCRRV